MTRDESPTWQEDEYEWHSNFWKSPNWNKTKIEIIKKDSGANWIGKKQKAERQQVDVIEIYTTKDLKEPKKKEL